jgi:tetratricopeptide (TPR) repeat protein
MSYLVLHIDMEFIVGTVCADNGNSCPITSGDDDLLWLYFFNDPHQNRISFGKENRTHFNNKELNYYGKLSELIENEQEKFTIRGIEKKTVELFEYSGLLKILTDKYKSFTHESPDNIPTLVAFSLSVSELAKQKIIEYLKNRGFQIDSYTIPLSELVCYYPFSKKDFLPKNGNTVLLLAATNTTLHLMKLVFSNSYFMIDGEVKSYKGKGIDPRKRALVRFVVNEINNTTGALSSEKEKEDECEKMEPKAEEWLKRIDVQSQNRPFRIVESFSKMPNARKEVLVRKEIIESDTGHYIQELMDIFDAYKSDNVKSDVAAIFLLGDCFQNSLVKSRFNKLIHNEKLFIYASKDIQNILTVYPNIDFKRYIDQEERSKALADAEKKKHDEQIAIEAKRLAEQDAEAKRLAEAKQAEENRKKAVNYYEQAVQLDKEGKLQDALANAETAVELDGNNLGYKRFVGELEKKIRELDDRTEKYKAWLKDAKTYEQSGDLENALKAYQYAQKIFDSAELRKTIVEIERKIEKREKEGKINNFISIAIALAEKGKFDDAINSVNKALEIDPSDNNAKETLKDIYAQRDRKEIEKKYSEIIRQADGFVTEQKFENAVGKYNEALQIKRNDEYCLSQTAKIKSLIQQKQNQDVAGKIAAEADKLFENNKWEIAKSKYEEALTLCPLENNWRNKLNQCADRIKAQDDKFKDCMFEATIAEKKGNLSKALTLLEEALKIKPDDAGIKSRIKQLKFEMEFDDGFLKQSTATTVKPKGDTDDDFFKKSTATTVNPKDKTDDDDFFSTVKSGNSTKDDDDDDFLSSPKKSKNDFLNW